MEYAVWIDNSDPILIGRYNTLEQARNAADDKLEDGEIASIYIGGEFIESVTREFADDTEPMIDDTVHCCPDCETPNQFGELCPACMRDRANED